MPPPCSRWASPARRPATAWSHRSTTFSDVADCLACSIEHTVAGMDAGTLGSQILPLAKPEARCHTAMARGMKSHVAAVLQTSGRCQRDVDRDDLFDTALCVGTDPKGKVALARTKAKRRSRPRAPGSTWPGSTPASSR